MSSPTSEKPTLGMRWKSWGVKWRSSYWFVTFVVWLGVLTDLVVYSIIVPVIPFELESLGYSDVSTLTGWLLFAYSAGLALSTVFVSMFAETYKSRQVPLLVGNTILIGSQIMFMEAPVYWVMCLARALQGIGSTMVWVVGLALICDVTPEALVGRQLGLALSGLTVGTLMGPPLGGALYSHLGFRAPFVLGIIFAFVDLIGRILIVEKSIGPAATNITSPDEEKADAPTEGNVVERADPSEIAAAPKASPNFGRVLITLSKSPRALVAGYIGMAYGVMAGLQDTILSLRLNDVWGLDSSKIGLVMLAAVIPTIFAPPIFGWLSDRQGTALIMLIGILMAIPWCGAMIVEGPLGLFIAAYALQSFFMSSVVSPLCAELAAVGRSIEGIGYAHVHGIFNFSFGVGSTLGPIVGGQFYDHLSRGFMLSYVFLMAVLGCGVVLTFFYSGDVSIAFKIYHRNAISLQQRGNVA
ncbi:major facilitator superfamily domain-containing protein [Mucidula mucida]|nr:major facilitator superfamily domain-containing protein [Mucidula mucida]